MSYESVSGEQKQTSVGPRGGWKLTVGVSVGAFAAYFLAAIVCLLLFATHELPSTLWISSGVLLSILLLAQRRHWPGVLIATFFAGTLANYVAGKPLGLSLGLGIVDAFEGWATATALVWGVNGRITFSRLRELAGLLLLSAIGANGVAALAGAGVFAIGPGSSFWSSWWLWFLSNGMGILVVTPFVVSWATWRRHLPARIPGSRIVEGIAVVVLMGMVAGVIFGPVQLYAVALPYLTFPFLVWAALRFGVPGASAAGLVLAVITVTNTAHGMGPIAVTAGTQDEKLLQVQAFIAAALACSLVPAIVIRERRDIEDQLRRSEARLGLAQEIGGLGSFEFDFLRNRAFWSEQAFRIAGRDPAAGEPTPAEHLQTIHPDDRDMMHAEMAKVKSGCCSEVDYRMVSPDGAVRYVHVMVRPVVNESGRVVKGLGTVMDITERRRMEEELRQAQKMEAVGRLAGGVAHDFNNLLGIIIGYAELALSELKPGEPLYNKIQPISKAASRAASLTSQLLAFSRKQVLKPQQLNLNSVVGDLGKMLRRLIGEQIELVMEFSPSLPMVIADPGQVEQVVMNLAVNAKDAMQSGGRLAISTFEMNVAADDERELGQIPPGKYVLLKVSDTGRGMDDFTKAHIFEPFFTTKEKGKGTGLGLATVYGIISQSQGHVWVESEVGRGTTFYICLPAAEQKTEVILAPVRETRGVERSETVLLVEDEKPLRELIREVLRSMGCTVFEALSGEDAIEMVRTRGDEIDVVLTDVVMPRMNGFELARKIAEVRHGIHVLYMSGYSDEMIKRQDQSGILPSFIQKPFKPEELRDKLHEIAEAKRAGQ